MWLCRSPNFENIVIVFLTKNLTVQLQSAEHYIWNLCDRAVLYIFQRHPIYPCPRHAHSPPPSESAAVSTVGAATSVFAGVER